MERSQLSDAAKANMFTFDDVPSAITTHWSGFIHAGASPADTLKDTHAPAFAMPAITPKTVAFAGDSRGGADYRIVGKLGEGGMGIVFEAEQAHLRRRVALKMIKAERSADPLARNSFFYEAVITAGLEHPGIIPVLEFGRSQDDRVFYVMKKASGVPWSRCLREKSLEENIAIFERVCDIIAYAHAQGVIHRDLKPANVLLGDFGEVWVGDWGVALHRSTQGDYRHAHPGGTPQYMPPEMARCDFSQLDERSDIYLLGAILHEIIAGAPPHDGDTPEEALENAAQNIIHNGADDDGLLHVARHAMASSPTNRYPNVDALRQALRQCRDEERYAALLHTAEAQFAAARKRGHYELYQQALTDYDAALAALPNSVRAKKGRLQTVLAYCRQALANGEFDLAETLVKPEKENSRNAIALLEEIKNARARAKRQPRRFRFVNAVLGGLVLCALVGGFYVYTRSNEWAYDKYRSRQKTDSYHFSQIRRELTQTFNELHAVWQNMGEETDAEQEQRVRIHEAMQILDNCRLQFAGLETPTRMRDACDYLHRRLSAVDALFTDIQNNGVDTLGKGQTDFERTVTLFGKLTKSVYSFRVAESR